MAYRIPPLNALRAFEATSRLASAKKAAEELHVTPAAISHQIKLLENQLGFPLFRRLNKQLLLTEAGQQYAQALQDIFKRLANETEKLTRHLQSTLVLTVEPAFAIYWLIPRLDKFKKLYPDIELRIAANSQIVELEKSQYDVGIRLGKGNYLGLNSILLFHNELSPVCSPTLVKKHVLKKPSDLKFHTLLHRTAAITMKGFINWKDWLKAANENSVDADEGIYFDTGHLAIQAAIEGQGVALERHVLVEAAIQQGKLIKPFSLSVEEKESGYYFVYPQDKKDDRKIQNLLSWIISEINQKIGN